MNDRFYKQNEEITFRFYQIPKALFNNPVYKNLSLGAKAAYAIMRDRLDLSKKNGWADEKDRIYLLFTNDNLAELLEVSEKTIRRYKKELEQHNLIVNKRQGQNKPNRIYILKPVLPSLPGDRKETAESPENTWNGQSDRTGTDILTTPERSKCPVNDTEYNDTEKQQQHKVLSTSTVQQTTESQNIVADVVFSSIDQKDQNTTTTQEDFPELEEFVDKFEKLSGSYNRELFEYLFYHLSEKGVSDPKSIITEKLNMLEEEINWKKNKGEVLMRPGGWLRKAVEENWNITRALPPKSKGPSYDPNCKLCNKGWITDENDEGIEFVRPCSCKKSDVF